MHNNKSVKRNILNNNKYINIVKSISMSLKYNKKQELQKKNLKYEALIEIYIKKLLH